MNDADDAMALMKAVRPKLVGRPEEIQGAALAGLTSIWLAGYVVRDDPKATERLRKDVLALHVETVQRLAPIYQALVESQPRPDA